MEDKSPVTEDVSKKDSDVRSYKGDVEEPEWTAKEELSVLKKLVSLSITSPRYSSC